MAAKYPTSLLSDYGKMPNKPMNMPKIREEYKRAPKTFDDLSDGSLTSASHFLETFKDGLSNETGECSNDTNNRLEMNSRTSEGDASSASLAYSNLNAQNSLSQNQSLGSANSLFADSTSSTRNIVMQITDSDINDVKRERLLNLDQDSLSSLDRDIPLMAPHYDESDSENFTNNGDKQRTSKAHYFPGDLT